MCYAGLSHRFFGVMFPLLPARNLQIMKSQGMRIVPVLVLVTQKNSGKESDKKWNATKIPVTIHSCESSFH